MTSRTVKSPTGADIEIVSDDDWAITVGVNPPSLRMWSSSKPFLIRELWEHGAVTEEKGRATAVLLERMLSHYPDAPVVQATALTMLMKDPTNGPAFNREIQGKRCYAIELVALPEIWYSKLRLDIGGSTVPVFTATPVDTNGTKPQPIDQPEVFVPYIETPGFTELVDSPDVSSPVIEVEIASQVAMELLTRVIEIVSTGSSHGVTEVKLRQLQTEYETVTNRLGQRLEENDRMRKQLRQTGEELAAVKLERDGLRQRLRQTEANLNSALKGESAHAVTTEVMKRVDRIMRETPKPHERGEE